MRLTKDRSNASAINEQSLLECLGERFTLIGRVFDAGPMGLLAIAVKANHFAAWTASLLLLCSGPLSAQSAATNDPVAVSLANESITALLGHGSVSTLVLTGDATWSAGDPETGTVTLKALGTAESRVDIALSNGTRSEIRDGSSGIPLGKYASPDGTSGAMASHNTMTDAVWFFPAFGSLTGGPNVVLTYVGIETRNGQSVQHLRSHSLQAYQSQTITPNLPDLSAMDFYLDASTLLPVGVTFNEHPDNDASTNIEVDVEFSNYQTFSGVQIPAHIRKSANGSPLLDITVTNAEFNTGLTLSDFSVN